MRFPHSFEARAVSPLSPRLHFRSSALIVATMCGLFTVGAQAQEVVVLPELGQELKSTIILQQEESSGRSVQVRDAGDENIRSIGQTFVWKGSGKLTGIGFQIAGEALAFKENQQYRVRVFHVAGIRADSKVDSDALAEWEVTLSPEMIQPGHHLYFKLPQPLELLQREAYLVQLAATSRTTQSVLHLATSAGDLFHSGSGMQFVNADSPEVVRSPDWDFAFFLTETQ